jgi:predicted nuclease of restriction endonuclease-like (RecB) superfamily
LLAVYQVENPDLSNEQLLFLREKQNYLRWLAPRISSLFVERTEQKIKSDSVVRVSWESDSLIDADATIVDSEDKQNLSLQDNLK